jgi:hypothetical protein
MKARMDNPAMSVLPWRAGAALAGRPIG